MEINPAHPIVKELLERIKEGETGNAETEELVRMLTETALINSGFAISNPTEFARRFYKLFNGAMGIPKDAPIEDIEIPGDEDEEDVK